MKHTIILLLIVILAGCKNKSESNKNGQENETVADTEEAIIDEAKPLNFNYTYPKNILPRNSGEIDFEFYPIGFSPEGHFAYVDRPCAGGCGCCSHTMFIQNLLSDKIETTHGINTSEYNERDHMQDWKIDYRNVKKKLIAKGISQSELFLETNKVFYDKSGTHKFEIKVSKKEVYNPDSEYGNNISYAVYVKMDDQKTKRITYGEFSDAVDFEYLGFIRSPFDDQLAVVVNQKSRGFEAEIFNNIYVVGCQLDPKYFR